MRLLPLLLVPLFFASCRSVPKQEEAAPGAVAVKAAEGAGGMVPAADVARAEAFFKAHKTSAMIPVAGNTPAITAANSWFVVDLDAQRTYFYTDKKLIAATKISSGRKYYRTETGDYTLGQKDLNHRSSSYGNFVSRSGGTVMGDVQNGFDPTPAGARFEGALMKYFMRFHHNGQSTAMGFHRGVLPGSPASHGCVRMPDLAASWFYAKAPMGTPIYVRGKTNGIPIGADQKRPKRSPRVHSSLKSRPAAEKPAVPPAPESDVSTPEPAVPAPAPAAVEPEPISVPAAHESPAPAPAAIPVDPGAPPGQ